MKTLDNLIKTLEEILPNPPSEGDLKSEGYYIQEDIIHYLKEYQALIHMLNLSTEINIEVSTNIKLN